MSLVVRGAPDHSFPLSQYLLGKLVAAWDLIIIGMLTIARAYTPKLSGMTVTIL